MHKTYIVVEQIGDWVTTCKDIPHVPFIPDTIVSGPDRIWEVWDSVYALMPELTGYQLQPRVVCAWCKNVVKENLCAATSHGICKTCYDAVMNLLATNELKPL